MTSHVLGRAQSSEIRQPLLSARWRRFLEDLLTYIVLTSLAFFFMIPLFWMISTALKPRWDMLVYPPQWIPSQPQWQNFIEVFQRIPFWRYTINTSILVIANIIGQLFAVPLAAFSFARLRFPGRDAIFFIVIATMMVPSQVTMIPLFVIFQRLGLVNTYWPLILPAFSGSAFFIFLLRQYIKTIPRDLDDAARIDGAGTWGILYRVILPLCRPPLTIIVVYTFWGVWNDFLHPLIYLNDVSRFTLQLGLAMFKGRFDVEWNLLMAATLMTVIPLLVVYFLVQKQLIGGIASVGLKG
jgi:ABC-type glycerol-3-phosphate transport system permease component